MHFVSSSIFVAISLTFIFLLKSCSCTDAPVQLTSNTFAEVAKAHELLFVDFYADWCHFSQMLKPIFQEAAKNVADGIGKDGRAILGWVDCEREGNLCQQHNVNKYPTMKLYRFGQAIKKEYRGERAVAALTKFVEEQLHDPVHMVQAGANFAFEDKKRYIVGHLNMDGESIAVKTFKKLGSIMRDNCDFVIYPRTADSQYKEDAVFFQESNGASNIKFSNGNLSDYEALHTWALDRCVPLVRELTFQNAEEFTEEGLPFFILFYHPNDKETPKRFREACQAGLQHQKYRATLLTADGLLFSHPLTHLGKSEKDLPLIAIDSFKHMYVYPKSVYEAMQNPKLLDQFLEDLHSGKLHREFHYGPDPVTQQEPASGDVTKSQPGDSKGTTQPHKSVFQKLQPSSTRYSILRDEL